MNLSTTLNTYRLPIFALIGAVLFSAFTIWAGIPERGLPAFLAGLGVFLVLTLFFAGLAWHLLARPLPPGQKQLRAEFLSPTLRRLFAVFLLAAGISLVIGGFWDEVWHRKYGLPFGEDLLWRPHLLIYFGLLTPPALAAFTLLRMLREGAGSLQQRFRADPPAGLLVLAGVFLLYTVPADPIWHTIYGEDITAWSLPHLLLLVGVTLVMLLAVVMQLSTTPRRPWSSILRRSWDELLALLAFTFAFQLQLQVMVTDWENGNPALTGRPEWLLPAMLIGLGIFMGVAANRSLRVYGAASLLGTLTLLLRWGLIQIFDFPAIQAESWLGILPPLLALDLLYALRVSRGQGPPPALSGWAGGRAGAGDWIAAADGAGLRLPAYYAGICTGHGTDRLPGGPPGCLDRWGVRRRPGVAKHRSKPARPAGCESAGCPGAGVLVHGAVHHLLHRHCRAAGERLLRDLPQ
jgi:hypothetical protein